MPQSCLMETGVGVEFYPTADQKTEIIFNEYEAGEGPAPKKEFRWIPTGRSWSGMTTDKDLFDLLLKAGVISADTYELGTGLKNITKAKQRNL